MRFRQNYKDPTRQTIVLDFRIPDRTECTLYLYDLAMSPVVGICEEGLGQVGEKVLEYGGALVHRELVIVQVQRDSLHINIELILLGDGWSTSGGWLATSSVVIRIRILSIIKQKRKKGRKNLDFYCVVTL
jgi:hypothetical protein